MKNRSTFLGIILIGILVIGTIYTLFIRPSYFRFNGGEAYLTTIKNTRVTEEYVSMVTEGEHIYQCNKNGLIKKNMDGETIWSKAFYMESPLLISTGTYFAVADITGKSVYVFDEKGFIREIKESYPIINIYINETGALTVVMEMEDQNLINIYREDGVLVVTRATRFIEDGYPIDVVSSPDTTKMVTGYLDVSENRLQTKIAFFGFDNQYDQLDEKIIGGFNYDNCLLSDLYWAGENTVVAVMDDKIVLYDGEAEPFVTATIEVYSELMDVIVTDNEIVVWYGKAIEEHENNYVNSVVAYNFTGELLSENTYDERILGIAPGEKGYFVYTYNQIIKYAGRSREWFSSTYASINAFHEISEDHFVIETSSAFEVLEIRTR